MLAVTPVIAVALTVIAGAVLFALLGKDPLASLRAFFITPVSTLYGLGELALKATPLVLIALGLAIGFRAGVWNIGAEGQLILGAVCGGGVQANSIRNDSSVREGARVSSSETQAWLAIGTKSTSHSA